MKEDEKKILDAARHQLSLSAEKLHGVEIEFSGPEHQVWDGSEKNYTSELRVKFYKHKKIEDVFEFHIYRNGKLLVSEDEIENWFARELTSLIKKRNYPLDIS